MPRREDHSREFSFDTVRATQAILTIRAIEIRGDKVPWAAFVNQLLDNDVRPFDASHVANVQGVSLLGKRPPHLGELFTHAPLELGQLQRSFQSFEALAAALVEPLDGVEREVPHHQAGKAA